MNFPFFFQQKLNIRIKFPSQLWTSKKRSTVVEKFYLGIFSELPLHPHIRMPLINPKPELPCKIPLKIVHKGPIHVTSDIHSILHQFLYLHCQDKIGLKDASLSKPFWKINPSSQLKYPYSVPQHKCLVNVSNNILGTVQNDVSWGSKMRQLNLSQPRRLVLDIMKMICSFTILKFWSFLSYSWCLGLSM